MRAALAELPQRARLVVLLIAVGDLSLADTATTLGLEVGTVKSIYSRVRSQLRRSLGLWRERSPRSPGPLLTQAQGVYFTEK
jgi:DNA-directed RNA polymerase specialized sigma24 family protein